MKQHHTQETRPTAGIHFPTRSTLGQRERGGGKGGGTISNTARRRVTLAAALLTGWSGLRRCRRRPGGQKTAVRGRRIRLVRQGGGQTGQTQVCCCNKMCMYYFVGAKSTTGMYGYKYLNKHQKTLCACRPALLQMKAVSSHEHPIKKELRQRVAQTTGRLCSK